MKMRKTLNVSLQSKKYATPINKILNNWEAGGSNTSAEVCEIILLFDKYDKSITLSNIKNIFELTQKMVGMYIDINSPQAINITEDVLREVITIDNSKLSVAMGNLNEKLSSIKVNTNKQEQIPEEPVQNNNVNYSKDENLRNSHNYNEKVENIYRPQRKSIQQSDENLIPMDFLSNN